MPTRKRSLPTAKQSLPTAKEYADAKKEAETEFAEAETELADAQQEIEELKKPEWIVSDRHDLPSIRTTETMQIVSATSARYSRSSFSW